MNRSDGWNAALASLQSAAGNANHQQVISQSTCIVQQRLRELLAVLDLRAASLAACAQFDRAHDDAALMRMLAPSSALGYLHAAKIFSMQGHQLRAIDMCDNGIAAVDPSNPLGHELAETRDAALQQQRIRVDFITKLPYDIVLDIIPRFLPETLFAPSNADTDSDHCSFLDVSRSWRERLQHCDDLSFVVTGTLHRGSEQFLHAAPYIKSLHVDIWDEPLHTLWAVTGGFASLVKLSVAISHVGVPCLFLDVLRRVGDTLTQLSLASLNGSTAVTLGEILNACPNLVSLECSDFDLDVRGACCDSYPRITALKLRSLVNTLSHHALLEVLSRFPALETLSMDHCTDSRLLLSLDEFCPALKCLIFNKTGPASPAIDIDTSLGPGLQTLYIDDLVVDPLHLGHILREHQDTLRELRYSIMSHLGRTERDTLASVISRAQFNRLELFNCDPPSGRAQYLASLIILHAPNLERAVFDNRHMYIDDGILDALGYLHKLKELDLNVDQAEETGLQRLAARYAALLDDGDDDHLPPTPSPIERITLQLGHSVLSNTLTGLFAAMPRLTHVTIGKKTIRSMALLTSAIEQLARSCPRVQVLRLINISSATDQTLGAVSQIDSLVHLELEGLSNITDSGVIALLQCTRLRFLRIINCPAGTGPVRTVLENKIAKVECN